MRKKWIFLRQEKNTPDVRMYVSMYSIHAFEYEITNVENRKSYLFSLKIP